MIKLGMVAVLLALFTLAPAPRAQAAAGIRLLGEPAVENRFPEGLVFMIEAEAEAEIREVRLRYTFIPDNRPVAVQPEFDPGARLHATYFLRSQTSSSPYIPPGKTLRYSWELRDAAGNELKTEERETAYNDPRFRWQQVTDGTVTLNYYRGTQRDAEVMAQIANETITKGAALLGTGFDFPVKIWAYASPRDFQIALAHASVTSDPGVLGQAHEPDTFIMVVDRLSSPTALDTARHELTHLVVAQALRNGPFKNAPAWLNEGVAVYMQVSPNDVGYVDALEKAVRDDTVVPIRSLTSGSRARDVGLFYGESYGLVKYLVESHGPEKFAQLLAAFNQTGSEDEAFRKVYGFDRDGLYREWRTSVGLKPDQAGAQPPTAPDAQAQGSSAGADKTTIALVAGATTLMVLLAAAAVAGGILLARRSQAGEEEE